MTDDNSFSDLCLGCSMIMEAGLLRLVKPDERLLGLFGHGAIAIRIQAKVDVVVCELCCIKNGLENAQNYLIDVN